MPSRQNKRSISRREKIRRLLAKGWDVEDIVDKLAGDDTKKRRVVRRQLAIMTNHDEKTQVIMGAQSRGHLINAMPSIAEAVAKRASKGNIPAAKLAMEASGFHNPRVDHKHSGDISITIKNAPRPERTVDEAVGDVVDAEVVDD